MRACHDACRSLHWRSKALLPNWASVVANPPGHMSNSGVSSTGMSQVAPGEQARLIRLQSPNQALSGVQV
jgi:hypothetical protein